MFDLDGNIGDSNHRVAITSYHFQKQAEGFRVLCVCFSAFFQLVL